MNNVANEAFRSGQVIFHNEHGVGEVITVLTEQIAGISLEMVELAFKHVRIKVPLKRVGSVLRTMSSKDAFTEALKILKQRRVSYNGPWFKTEKILADKLNSGLVTKVCEVVRDTARGEDETISTSQLQVFDAAVMRLVKEYATVFAVDHETACAELQMYCPRGMTLRVTDAHGVTVRKTGYKRSAWTQTEPEDRPYSLPKKQTTPRVVRKRKPKVEKPPRAPRPPKPNVEKLPRVVKEPKPTVPKPPRVPKPRVVKPPRKRAAPKLTKQAQIEMLQRENEQLAAKLERTRDTLKSTWSELAAQKKALRGAAHTIAKLREQIAVSPEAATEIESLKAERTILRRKVTHYTKRVAALEEVVLSEKNVHKEIKRVRQELFDFIRERTQQVERLQAYIRERNLS
jgi:CarD family transcriptional regulator